MKKNSILFMMAMTLTMNANSSECLDRAKHYVPFDRRESEEIRKCLVLVGAFSHKHIQREIAYFLLDEMMKNQGVLSTENDTLLETVIKHYSKAHFGYATGRSTSARYDKTSRKPRR